MVSDWPLSTLRRASILRRAANRPRRSGRPSPTHPLLSMPHLSSPRQSSTLPVPAVPNQSLLLRHDAIAADVDAVCLQRAVRLLGCCEHGEPRAHLEIVLVADLVTDDWCVRRNDDLLLAVLVFDHHRRAIDARDRCAGGRAIGHGAVRHGRIGPVTLAGAAHLFGEDVHLQGLLTAVGLRQCRAAKEVPSWMSAIEAFTTAMIIAFSVSVSLTSAPSLDFNESTLPSAFSIVPFMRMVCAVAAEHDAAIIAPANTSRIVLVISFPRNLNSPPSARQEPSCTERPACSTPFRRRACYRSARR